MVLKIHNTLSGTKETFEPVDKIMYEFMRVAQQSIIMRILEMQEWPL